MNIINNLFRIFDPSSSFFSFNWLIITPIILLLPKPIISILNKINILILFSSLTSIKESHQLISDLAIKIAPYTIKNLFIFLLITNLIALFPFNFTTSAHLSISLSISLSFWISIILNSLINSFSTFITHLTPIGTPTQLMSFIVIIEIVRALIRPITLSIRLTANILAGHLLISLLSNYALSTLFLSLINLPPITILCLLEIIVAIIQAYVITTLLTLYYNESL